MKVVYVDAPEELIRERHRLDLDRRDEVWEGVYHIAPMPTCEHLFIVGELFTLVDPYAKKHGLGRMCIGLGIRDLRSPKPDYRIPDWIFLRSGREFLLQPDSGTVDEGPDAALEVRSPGDETDEKIPFYEKLAVRELVVIDRDTRAVEIVRHGGGRFRPVSPNADGWTYSESLRAFFRTATVEGKPKLLILLELDHTEHAV